jgi:hypothetical protein
MKLEDKSSVANDAMRRDKSSEKQKMMFGLIVGNRADLANSGREEMLRTLEEIGIDAVVLGSQEGKHGAVETYEEAKRRAGKAG